jgi:hypothetical protein
MRAPDAKQFKKAIKKEVAGHTEKGYWKVVRKTEASHAKILLAVWSMKQKRRIEMHEV